MRVTVIRVGRLKAYQITSLYGPPMRPKWKRFIDRCCEFFFGRSGRWLL